MAVNSIQESSLGVEQRSDDESWRTSCSSCSESPATHLTDIKYCRRSSKHHHSRRLRRKSRSDHMQRNSILLMDAAPPIMHVPGTNHERSRSLPLDPTLNAYPRCPELVVRPILPSHHGIYYSYLEHKVSEELNSESDK